MSRDVNDYPRYRALRQLFIALWDMAVGGPSYDRHLWNEVASGFEELARKGLGLPDVVLPDDERTPVDVPVQVLEGSADGDTWKELARSVVGAPTIPLDIRSRPEYPFLRARVKTRGSKT